MALLMDSELVIRCLYCPSGLVGKMVGHIDGRFICVNCGHTARPADPCYECTCRQCRLATANARKNLVANKG